MCPHVSFGTPINIGSRHKCEHIKRTTLIHLDFSAQLTSLRREGRSVSAEPVCSCALLLAQIARETAGAACTRSSLRPLTKRAGGYQANLGRNASRDREVIFGVIVRLVRNCALGRTIQYSRDVDDRTDGPRRTGYPAFAGYDVESARSTPHPEEGRAAAVAKDDAAARTPLPGAWNPDLRPP